MRKVCCLLVLVCGVALCGDRHAAGAAALSAAEPAEATLAPVVNQPCVTSATTLCLQRNQFSVTATFQTPTGAQGQAQAVPLTDDTGYFWFFSSANVEFVLKVIDGCSVNEKFWVFAGGLTNVRVDITVRDSESGVSRHYANPLNTPFQPLQDTSATPCPPSSARFKLDIEDMGAAGEGLMNLHPGSYHFRPAAGDSDHLLQYGLVTEEVAQLFPGLVQYDGNGKPIAVRYHFIDALLLNELQKQNRAAVRQRGEIAELRRQIEDVTRRLNDLERR